VITACAGRWTPARAPAVPYDVPHRRGAAPRSRRRPAQRWAGPSPSLPQRDVARLVGTSEQAVAKGRAAAAAAQPGPPAGIPSRAGRRPLAACRRHSGPAPALRGRRRLAACVEHALRSDPAVAAALRRDGITISGSNPRQPMVSLSDSGRSRDLLSKGSSPPFHLTSRKSRRGTGISRGSRSLGGTSWQMSRPMAASFAGLSKKARRARVSVSGSIRC
jgi:hypothetical protein